MRFITIILLSLTAATPAWADAKSRAAREAAEYVLQRFGRGAVREGTEVLARRIEAAAVKHGDEVFVAVRKTGEKALTLIDGAGAQSGRVVKVLAQHGEAGAIVVARPAAMKLIAKHGEEAASVLVKHAGGIGEPLVEQFGSAGVKALAATGPQGGRRLAMLLADGDLAKIGRTQELLAVVTKFGDRAMAFVWKNKGALATTAGIGAFLANPEVFITGAKDIAQVVGENAIKPLAQTPGVVAAEVAKGTNWTVIFLAVGVAGVLLIAVKWRLFHRPGLSPSTQAADTISEGHGAVVAPKSGVPCSKRP